LWLCGLAATALDFWCAETRIDPLALGFFLLLTAKSASDARALFQLERETPGPGTAPLYLLGNQFEFTLGYNNCFFYLQNILTVKKVFMKNYSIYLKHLRKTE
jgi:hypothetical protein